MFYIVFPILNPTQSGLATVQVFNSHMWQVAMLLGSMALGYDMPST